MSVKAKYTNDPGHGADEAEGMRFRNPGCCHRRVQRQLFSPSLGKIIVVVLGAGPPARGGLAEGHSPASAGVGAGGLPRPRFDLKGRGRAQDARVKWPVLPRQSRILPRNDGSPKGWPSGVPMVEGGRRALQASIVPLQQKVG